MSQRRIDPTDGGCSLERDRLLTRTVFPTIQPRVDHELTDPARALAHRLRQACDLR